MSQREQQADDRLGIGDLTSLDHHPYVGDRDLFDRHVLLLDALHVRRHRLESDRKSVV